MLEIMAALLISPYIHVPSVPPYATPYVHPRFSSSTFPVHSPQVSSHVFFCPCELLTVRFLCIYRGSPEPFLVLQFVRLLCESCNSSRFPILSSPCNKFRNGGSLQYSPCLPCLWHRAFLMRNVVHFPILYSIRLLFSSTRFSLGFQVCLASHSLCVLTYVIRAFLNSFPVGSLQRQPCIHLESNMRLTLSLPHFHPKMLFLIVKSVFWLPLRMMGLSFAKKYFFY